MGAATRAHKVELGKQVEAANVRIKRLEDVLKALSMQVMQSFGGVYANEKALETFVEKLDMNDRAIRFIFLEMFGHLQQANTLLGILTADENLSDRGRMLIKGIDLEELKSQARAWLDRVASGAFKAAESEKTREEEENKRLAEEQREKAKKEEEAKQTALEGAKAEEALLAAEKHSRNSPSGGAGASIPEGAYVFGGD